ncbi:MAG: type II toxin-antitoxin system HicB family antitoxin [Candidatus Heimdallarchaeota archaeon]
MSTLTAIIYKEDDMYVAECPQVGTASQGETFEEALTNLKEATELYLEEFPQTTESQPIITTFEVIPKGVDKTAKV